MVLIFLWLCTVSLVISHVQHPHRIDLLVKEPTESVEKYTQSLQSSATVVQLISFKKL